jgi:hypothetical protein
MGKINNYNEHTFSLFNLRIGNIQARNYSNVDGIIKSLGTITDGKYAKFEINKIQEDTQYTIAYWVNMDTNEYSPDLKFVGARPFNLDSYELATFMRIAEITQKHISTELYNIND